VANSFVGGFAVQRIILRPVEKAPVLSNVIVFIGLLVIFNSLAGWIFEHTIKAFPSPFDQKGALATSIFSAHELGSALVMLCVLVALWAFFKFTPVGLAMRAAAQNPESARLVGIRVSWMLAMGWGLAAAIGAVAGMMVAPVVYLDPNMMSGILLYGFAAALLGGIDNPGGAVLGLHRRRAGEPAGRLRHRHRAQAERGAGADRHHPDPASGRPVRQARRDPGVSTP